MSTSPGQPNSPGSGPKPLPHGLRIDPTEFKAAWRIVLLAALGVGISANAALLYTFGVLVVPLQQAFGWERADIMVGVSFLFIGAFAGAQLIGWLNLRFGMKLVTLLSLGAMSLAYVVMTRIGPSIIELYVMMFVVAFASMGTMLITWTHLVNLWYERNRGLALSLVLSGTGMAAIFLPSAVTAVITRWDWQAAFWLLAALPLAVILLALAWMKEPAHARPAASAARSAAAARSPLPGLSYADGLRTWRFWVLNVSLSLVVACIVAVVVNGVSLLIDKGLNAADAARIFGTFGISLILGRVVVGYLLDRTWAPGVSALALSLPAVGCGVLLVAGADNTTMLVVGVMLIGIGAGAEMDIAAYLMSRYFGMRDYGRLFGMHVSWIIAAGALSPWLFSMLYQSTGSFNAMLMVCGVLFLSGGMMMLMMGRYPRFATAPQPAA